MIKKIKIFQDQKEKILSYEEKKFNKGDYAYLRSKNFGDNLRRGSEVIQRPSRSFRRQILTARDGIIFDMVRVSIPLDQAVVSNALKINRGS